MNNKIKLARGRVLELSEPVIMGIVNVTPDSFSDGGQFFNTTAALNHAMQLLDEGATILDIGGESTRPGAPDVSLEDELQRVIPLINAIREQSDCVISIDTSKAEVMRQAIEAGADIVNDVRALQEPGAIEVVAQYPDVVVCLMHMQGQPRSMQNAPHYDDLASEINDFFNQRIAACEAAGIKQSQLILDPGFGFGKTMEHNYELLNNLKCFEKFKFPILVGASRKSMIYNILDGNAETALNGTTAINVMSLQNGANILRVHDVKEAVECIKIVNFAKSCNI